MQNQPERAFEALHKEIEFHPDNFQTYRLLASVQVFHRKPDEAIETLRSLLKVAPQDLEAAMEISSLLGRQKRYEEIPPLLKPILEKKDEPAIGVALANALLRAGHKSEGIAAIQKYVKSDDSSILNNAAYTLAETRADLPLAKEYAEKAVAGIETESAKQALSDISEADLRRVSLLAAAWDTLGWVYFQTGDMEKAERFIDASWRLSQAAVVADHLGQVYERQGKLAAAIHMWQLALAADRSLDETSERLRKAGGSIEPRPALKRGGKPFVSAAEELGKLRTADIPALPKQEGSAEFFILFSAQGVEDVQFISGSESLKGAASALRAAKYDVKLPDDREEKLVRRGILSCSSYTSPSCQFVMLLPATTHK